MKKKNEMYVYLAKRDKSGVKFLGSFSYPSKVYPTKIDESNMKSLNMSPKASSEIMMHLKENIMDHELFLETAGSLEELKSSLRKRGYSKIPTHQFSSGMRPGNINSSVLVTENSTMMRRGSVVR